MIKGIVIGPFSYEDEQALLQTYGEFSLIRYNNTNHWGILDSYEDGVIVRRMITFRVYCTDVGTQGYAFPGTYIIYSDYMDKDLKSQIVRALDKVGEGGLIRVTDDTAVLEFDPG